MIDKIREFVDEYINPALAGHDGHLSVVGFDSETSTLEIRFSGGCQGCAASKETLQGQVAAYLLEEFPDIVGIADVTDHTKGENPYYEDR